MTIDSTGRPLIHSVIHAPGRDVPFVGNIYDIMRETANARFHGFELEIVEGPR